MWKNVVEWGSFRHPALHAGCLRLQMHTQVM